LIFAQKVARHYTNVLLAGPTGTGKELVARAIHQISVRLIAATNRDLRAEVLTGHFREGLFYRLSSIQIRIPSLTERLEDIRLCWCNFS